jgi:hypothetical protein
LKIIVWSSFLSTTPMKDCIKYTYQRYSKTKESFLKDRDLLISSKVFLILIIWEFLNWSTTNSSVFLIFWTNGVQWLRLMTHPSSLNFAINTKNTLLFPLQTLIYLQPCLW